MAEEKNKAVATVPSFIPSELVEKGTRVQGFEALGIDTMAVPFLKVLNALSPELNEDNKEYIKGAKQGDVINSITKTNYGRSFDFVVLQLDHMFVEWQPNRGGFVGYHTPQEAIQLAVDKTKFGKWLTMDGNELQETYMYYLLIVGHEHEGVVIFSADSADIKNAKKLNTLLMNQRFADNSKAPPFCQVYTATSSKMVNEKGTWYALDYALKRVFGEPDATLYKEVEDQRSAIGKRAIDYNLLTSNGETKKTLPDVEY